ncbi:hypothetical protein D0T49_00540 [Paludibacter sp. 221]|uniref:hypothetical protein n=1 Tax=Paludibacter sp. 221 TaxID=2302939 RepID=UPI0013D4A929|nr:hypothetical protein [Paludibacter sp. 221]NDV45540.1 hypothetical protein [Paludibacter sp. 221]
MNRKQFFRQTLIFVCIFQFSFFIFSAKAQVTIGSDAAPNAGALLDLKDNSNGTSTKGFQLPRVALTSLTSLSPCYSGTDDTEIANHKGLQVYNTNTTIGEGVYTWDGAYWGSANVDEVIRIGWAASTEETDLFKFGSYTAEKTGVYLAMLSFGIVESSLQSGMSYLRFQAHDNGNNVLFNSHIRISIDSTGRSYGQSFLLVTMNRGETLNFCANIGMQMKFNSSGGYNWLRIVRL